MRCLLVCRESSANLFNSILLRGNLREDEKDLDPDGGGDRTFSSGLKEVGEGRAAQVARVANWKMEASRRSKLLALASRSGMKINTLDLDNDLTWYEIPDVGDPRYHKAVTDALADTLKKRVALEFV